MDALHGEVAESKDQLERLQEKLDELESQKQEAISAIAEAKRLLHTKQNSSAANIFQLKGVNARTLPAKLF